MSPSVVNAKPIESLCRYCKHLTGDWGYCDNHVQDTCEAKNPEGKTILLTITCTGYERSARATAARQGMSEGRLCTQ